MIITSTSNEIVKETAKLLQKKYRDEKGLFLIEGEKGIEEAISSGIKIERVFCSDKKVINIDLNEDVLIETNEVVMTKISDTKSVPKVVAVAQKPKNKLENFKTMNKVVLLEGIKDAGNLGTILRTAAAFSIDAVILYGDTVDLYNPKTVRASVGNLWKIPVYEIKDFEIIQRYFDNYERIATLPSSKNTINLCDYEPKEKSLIMFGSEADGLSQQLKDFATKNLTIEMEKSVESLNLAVSAAIILYKFRL